jgi:hypothetical protein
VPAISQYFVSVDAVALVAATAKSVFELATPSTNRGCIKEYWIEFDASAAGAGVKVEVGRFSAAVTTATSVTPSKADGADGPSLCTTKHSTSAEGAGTASDVFIHRIPPNGGYHYISPSDSGLIVAVSSFFRIRLTAAATVNATFGCVWEE